MCKICALAARYPRVQQDSLVFNLSQFTAAITSESTSEQPQKQTILSIQENSS